MEENNDRFTTINALLIALVTVLGAIVAWRSAVASNEAGDAGLAGLTATRNVQETLAINNTKLYESYRAYTAYTRYNALGNEMEQELEEVTDEETAATLDRQMREAWDVAEAFYFPREYLRRDQTYDTQRALGEAWAEAARQTDLNPEPHFAEADRMQAKSNNLVAVVTALAVALVFFTLAETFTGRALQYSMAALGVIVMIGGTIAFIGLEFSLF